MNTQNEYSILKKNSKMNIKQYSITILNSNSQKEYSNNTLSHNNYCICFIVTLMDNSYVSFISYKQNIILIQS